MEESTRTEQPHPCILGNTNAKRRVETIRLSEPSQSTGTKESERAFTNQQKIEAAKSTRTETGSEQTVSSSTSLNSPSSRLEPKNIDSAALSNPEHSFKSSSQSLKPMSTSFTKDVLQEEKREQRPVKTPEGPSESSVTQDSPNITANKENEVEGGWQAAAPIVSTLRSPTPVSQGGLGKTTCKTSPLTKQAVEMLQDIQSQSPVSTPPKKRTSSDLLLPKTPVPGHLQDDLLDSLRTPSRQRHGHEGEGTPRHLAPPATPDLPTCSPASEAGSENSINMAAHTLMILSRAARTGGPLKNSLRQEEAGAAKSSASKGKKRKHTDLSPTVKKDLHLTSSSGSKKKAKVSGVKCSLEKEFDPMGPEIKRYFLSCRSE